MRAWSLTAAMWLTGAGSALAQDGDGLVVGKPHPWQITLQDAYSPIEEQIHWFSDYTLFFIVPITAFVAGLLAWCVWRYRAEKNPNPSRTSHNTTIEVIWTLAPVVILLLIAIPSFQLLTNQYNPPRQPEMTVKATGYQWYWGYEYQPIDALEAVGDGELGGEAATAKAAGSPVKTVSFESYPVDEASIRETKGDLDVYPRLLAVDNELVVPVDTIVRVITTSADVIHSWAVPSLGVKVDAVPGRANEYWFEALREGIFYGQCSELCGANHWNMPIAVRAVSKQQYDNWYKAALDDVSSANKQLTAEIKADRTAKTVAAR